MRDLSFLVNVSDEELEFLADIIRNKGGITNDLGLRSNYSSRRAYVNAIEKELLDFGSNTLWFQEDYKTILTDVCDKMNVSYRRGQSITEIETNLLGEVSSQLWNKATAEGRRALLETIDKNKVIMPQASAATFAMIFRQGGFASYQLSVIIVNALAKLILGRGLSFAANAMLTRALSFISGPLGVLMGLWTVKDILEPAYRVTVPAVICVAGLRQITINQKYLPTK